MSDIVIQQPIYGITCDADVCTTTYVARAKYGTLSHAMARREASRIGWDIPPDSGKGSRRGTDFCPAHALRDGDPRALHLCQPSVIEAGVCSRHRKDLHTAEDPYLQVVHDQHVLVIACPDGFAARAKEIPETTDTTPARHFAPGTLVKHRRYVGWYGAVVYNADTRNYYDAANALYVLWYTGNSGAGAWRHLLPDPGWFPSMVLEDINPIGVPARDLPGVCGKRGHDRKPLYIAENPYIADVDNTPNHMVAGCDDCFSDMSDDI